MNDTHDDHVGIVPHAHGQLSKYRAKPTLCRQRIWHASIREATRCNELHLLHQGGEIMTLEAHPQPKYDLAVNGVHICSYVADFRYWDRKRGLIIEDTKGVRTREYVIKRKLMLACHGIKISEV